MILFILLAHTFGLGVVKGDPIVLNTTVAATNIESTIGTPSLLIDPTLASNQNTTDAQYEVSFFLFIKFDFTTDAQKIKLGEKECVHL